MHQPICGHLAVAIMFAVSFVILCIGWVQNERRYRRAEQEFKEVIGMWRKTSDEIDTAWQAKCSDLSNSWIHLLSTVASNRDMQLKMKWQESSAKQEIN